MTPLQAKLREIETSIAKAHRHICDLASGKAKWTMCVPVQSDDSDAVLQAPLDHLERLCAALRVADEALEGLHKGCNYMSWGVCNKCGSNVNAKARAKVLEIIEGEK